MTAQTTEANGFAVELIVRFRSVILVVDEVMPFKWLSAESVRALLDLQLVQALEGLGRWLGHPLPSCDRHSIRLRIAVD